MLEYVRKDAEDSQRKINGLGLLGGPSTDPSDLDSEKRRQRRVPVRDRVRTTIFVNEGGDGKLRLVRAGVTRDLSVDGSCLVLDSGAEWIPAEALVDQIVKLRLELGDSLTHQTVDALSRIAWAKEEADTLVLGVQFVEVPKDDRHILEHHCARDAGEESLLHHLWTVRVSGNDKQEIEP